LLARGSGTRLSVMAAIPMSDIRKLSVSDRIQLVEDIWDTVVAEAAQEGGAGRSGELLPVTEAQREVLDERLADAERDRGAGSSWPEVKARLLRRA
jgi:putative addiction module component (TIGR02574 family)